jgi:Protein of unknown function (DUF1348)
LIKALWGFRENRMAVRFAYDYASNVALYPAFQAYFRERQPKLLAIWGKNDPFGGNRALKSAIASMRLFGYHLCAKSLNCF